MSSFVCPLCSTNRDFTTFHKMFQHITLYHQNEPNFKISCDIDTKCGVLYRTYSAYKSHVYRSHSSLLHSTKQFGKFFHISGSNEEQQIDHLNVTPQAIVDDVDDEEEDDDLESIFFEDDDDDEIFFDQSCSSNSNFIDKQNSKSLFNIKRSYVSFILQLREEFLLPKYTVNVISTYLISLLHHTQDLVKEKAFLYSSNDHFKATSSQTNSKQAISFDDLELTFKDICNTIESVAKNEYQFLRHCETYLKFSPAEEIPLSSSGEQPQYGYFIPVDKSLSLMLQSKSLVVQTLENIHRQRLLTEQDSDLMFSIRDGRYGHRVDSDNLLIQLYVDDIGLTNPLGSKRDRHKLCMCYFSIEDIPDKYRSKLDFIQLVGICESNILKVKILMIYIINPTFLYQVIFFF